MLEGAKLVNAATIQAVAEAKGWSGWYGAGTPEVMMEFKKRFPNTVGCDVLTMKAVLENDVLVVKVQGRKAYILLFADDTPKLVAHNRKMAEHRRRIDQAQRERRFREAQALMEDPVWAELGSVLKTLNVLSASLR